MLKNVSVSVDKGEVVSLIGSSGAGKTTLLNCLTLLEKFDEGTLRYGEDVVDPNTKDLSKIRREFSLVFQSFNLFPHMSVLENLCNAPVVVLKKDKKESQEKALALLNKFGLGDKANFYPYQLSGGQKRRVAIARALMMGPEIIFFDEPTSALDPEYTLEVLKSIEELKKEKMTMFIVSHEMAFVKQVSDRILFLDKGEIIEEGNPKQIFESPKNERTAKFLNNYLSDYKI